jgi:adenylosuccinate synthase
MINSVIVVGVQWGDEGKGKVVDLLSEKADFVVRSQGGNNAGHTIVVNNVDYKFHLIPSGALYPHATCLVTGGTVIDPSVLHAEIKGLEKNGVKLAGRLKISGYSHVIMPYHRLLDKLYEQQKGDLAIGTTGKGIGPCYSDKALRIGFQLGELLNLSSFKSRLAKVVDIKNQELHSVFGEKELNVEDVFKEYEVYANELRDFISFDVETELAVALKQKKKVLFEGAHGTFLDTTFGTYPYVTSSSTVASGVSAGAGVGPSRIDHVVGVVKAYTTRVGNGPLPTALSDEDAKLFLDNITAREVGTTTGRNRRLGWFDAPLVKHAIHLNGVDSMAIMKLDILDHLPQIKICTGYLLRGEKLSFPPGLTSEWEHLEPIYEVLPGWMSSTKDILHKDQLPINAQKYIDKLEQLCECPVSIISLGPDREKTIFTQNFLN